MAEREALFASMDARGILTVRVTPNARSARIAVEPDSAEGISVRIWVTVPPEDGKANKAVIALLAKALGLPKSALSIERGDTSRLKQIRISL